MGFKPGTSYHVSQVHDALAYELCSPFDGGILLLTSPETNHMRNESGRELNPGTHEVILDPIHSVTWS
jgi:hypothetical protein